MDREQESVILNETFDRVCQEQEKFARSVYDLFFDRAPNAKVLFERTNWEQQKKMLVGALMLMVKNLHNPSLFRITMHNLAERHVRYGVKAQHFPPFSQAVLQSIRNQIGSAWNAEIEDAWNFGFGQIEQLMIEAGVK